MKRLRNDHLALTLRLWGRPSRRHLAPREGLVDRADLCAVATFDGLHQRQAVVGIDGRERLRAGDGDVGGAGIDCVGAEALQVGHDAGSRNTLGAVYGRN